MKTMKTSVTLVLLLLSAQAGAQETMETAWQTVKNIRAGWNLGNELEANSGDTTNMWIERWTDRTPKSYEEAWGQKASGEALFKMMRDAGFNAIRIPVTWYPHTDTDWGFEGNSTVWSPYAHPLGSNIDPTWMKRVHEVVDYAINNGMYCILNIHHDTGASNTGWLRADTTTYNRVKDLYAGYWRQIATEFKDYGDHLLFEGYNEMLDTCSSWCFASFKTKNYYDAAIAKDAYEAINRYAQTFVDVVRSTGGNNATRNLIVSTYGACDGHGSWSPHLNDPLTYMQLPKDVTKDHLLFEVHNYQSLDESQNYSPENEADAMMEGLQKYLVSKGAPVIIGEWGASNQDAYNNNYHDKLIKFASHYVEKARSYNIPTFYWMGLSNGQDRLTPKFSEPDLRDAIIKAAYPDGVPTSVRKVETTSKSDDTVYDLRGIRRGTSTATLPQGVYIVNGKKVMK